MNPTSTEPRKTALREAGHWLLRMQEEDVPSKELEAWCDWMASPANAAAGRARGGALPGPLAS
jgi:ferric-dicitrate binding protein FerR (iron transport regulator)